MITPVIMTGAITSPCYNPNDSENERSVMIDESRTSSDLTE